MSEIKLMMFLDQVNISVKIIHVKSVTKKYEFLTITTNVFTP